MLKCKFKFGVPCFYYIDTNVRFHSLKGIYNYNAEQQDPKHILHPASKWRIVSVDEYTMTAKKSQYEVTRKQPVQYEKGERMHVT